MDLNELDELLHRYVNDESRPGEMKKVEVWLKENGYHKDEWPEISESLKEKWLNSLFTDIKKSANLHHAPNRHKNLFLGVKIKYLSIAATLLLLAAVVILFKNKAQNPVKPVPKTTSIYKNDIAPGGNKAILILADGTAINLDNSEKGELAKQGNATIQNIGHGQLVYNTSARNTIEQAEQINQITTPRGGQYQLTLADGTKVWLNAASSLKFPSSFSRNERKVELTGEAYFEVAKNKHKPFKVITNNQVVEVLGTHFNINAYAEEPGTKTTLIEGSVRVAPLSGKNPEHFILSPGEQSTLKGNTININNVNTDEVLAWKNGIFMFNNVNVYTLMNQISRWYDVKVEYKGELPKISFGGTVSRFKNVSELLRTIELMGIIHFRIEERRIIVMQ